MFSPLPAASLQEFSSSLLPPFFSSETIYILQLGLQHLALPDVSVGPTDCEKDSMVSVRLGSAVLCLVFQVSSIPVAVAKYPQQSNIRAHNSFVPFAVTL